MKINIDLAIFLFKQIGCLYKGDLIKQFSSRENFNYYRNLYQDITRAIDFNQKYINIFEDDIKKLINLYYSRNGFNKTIQDIEKDFIIKSLLE